MDGLNGRPAPFRAELERVLNSETFRGSENLRRLLAYLGEKSLAGEGHNLKEFTIGIEAFARPAAYNPQEDSTVRVLASKLRHRLDEYYRTEGKNDPVRVELPKGHYALSFRGSEPGGKAFPPHVDPHRRWRAISLVLAAALVLVLSAAAWHWLRGTPVSTASHGWTPELEAFWRPYLKNDRPVLFVLGAPLFTKLGGSFFRDPKINQWEDAESSGRVRSVQQALKSPYAIPSFNFTGVGEATSAFLLTKLMAARTSALLLKRSNTLSWDDIGAHNVVFFGSPKFNPQSAEMPFEQQFVISGGSLRNLRPRAGEPDSFPEIWSPSRVLLEDHALITRLPGLHGRGEITILAASSTEGTWAATEYCTEPLHAKDLVSKLRLPSGEMPRAYQIVVRATFKDRVPIDTTYVTHRLLALPGGG